MKYRTKYNMKWNKRRNRLYCVSFVDFIQRFEAYVYVCECVCVMANIGIGYYTRLHFIHFLFILCCFFLISYISFCWYFVQRYSKDTLVSVEFWFLEIFYLYSRIPKMRFQITIVFFSHRNSDENLLAN